MGLFNSFVEKFITNTHNPALRAMRIVVAVFLTLAVSIALVCFKINVWCGFTFVVTFLIVGYIPQIRGRGYPGPKGYPYFGTIFNVLIYGYAFAYDEWYKLYKPICMYYSGNLGVVLLTDIESVVSVCITNFREAFENRGSPVYTYRKGNGIFMARNAFWRTLRDACTPVFAGNNLRQFAPIMVDAVHETNNILQTKVDEGIPVNLGELFGNLTMHVIGQTSFGVKLSQRADDKTARELTAAARTITYSLGDAAIGQAVCACFPFLSRFMDYIGRAQIFKVMSAAQRVDDITRSVREERSKNPDHEIQDFLHYLFRAVVVNEDKTTRSFTEDEVRDQSNAFMFAGYESTGHSFAFTALLLAQHPEVEKKLLAEIDNNAPPGTEVTYDDLNKFTYTDWVVKESLRLFPPAAIAWRCAEKDCNVMGYMIKKDTYIYIPIYSIHRDERYWVKPNEFRPERFDPKSEEMSKRNSNVYMPFGIGPRRCIAPRFASEEMRLGLIHVYQQYRFELTQKTKNWLRDLPPHKQVRCSFMLGPNPDYPIEVTVHPRQERYYTPGFVPEIIVPTSEEERPTSSSSAATPAPASAPASSSASASASAAEPSVEFVVHDPQVVTPAAAAAAAAATVTNVVVTSAPSPSPSPAAVSPAPSSPVQSNTSSPLHSSQPDSDVLSSSLEMDSLVLPTSSSTPSLSPSPSVSDLHNTASPASSAPVSPKLSPMSESPKMSPSSSSPCLLMSDQAKQSQDELNSVIVPSSSVASELVHRRSVKPGVEV